MSKDRKQRSVSAEPAGLLFDVEDHREQHGLDFTEREALDSALMALTSRRLVAVRALLAGESLRETGKRMGVTHERVRQIRLRALSDLRRELDHQWMRRLWMTRNPALTAAKLRSRAPRTTSRQVGHRIAELAFFAD
jgi:DNA-directed RNA polymerase sigma subunit (sigma70/sigma32)